MHEVELKTVWKAVPEMVVAGMSHNPLRIGYDGCRALTYLPDIDMVRIETLGAHGPSFLPRAMCGFDPVDVDDLYALAHPPDVIVTAVDHDAGTITAKTVPRKGAKKSK